MDDDKDHPKQYQNNKKRCNEELLSVSLKESYRKLGQIHDQSFILEGKPLHKGRRP